MPVGAHDELPAVLIAGMGRNGWQAPITRVHLVIDYGAGHKVQTTTSIIGFGGWG